MHASSDGRHRHDLTDLTTARDSAADREVCILLGHRRMTLTATLSLPLLLVVGACGGRAQGDSETSSPPGGASNRGEPSTPSGAPSSEAPATASGVVSIVSIAHGGIFAGAYFSARLPPIDALAVGSCNIVTVNVGTADEPSP